MQINRFLVNFDRLVYFHYKLEHISIAAVLWIYMVSLFYLQNDYGGDGGGGGSGGRNKAPLRRGPLDCLFWYLN